MSYLFNGLLVTLAFISIGCISLTTDETTLTSNGFQQKTINSYELEWRVTQNTELEIKVSTETDGWIGFGINKTAAKMENSNIIIGYISEENEAIMLDGYCESNHTLIEDISNGGSNDITFLSSSYKENITTLHFSIPLESIDSNDIPLIPNETYYIILAKHNSNKSISTDITNKHDTYSATTITIKE